MKQPDLLKKILLTFAVAFLANKCSFNRFMVDQAAGLMQSGKAAFEREPDLEIAETALAANLKLLEALLQKDPENPKLTVFLAQGYSLYSLAFVEDLYEEYQYTDIQKSNHQKKRAVMFYNRARDYAGIPIYKKLKIKGPNEITRESLEAYLKNVNRKDADHLFWFAFSWGSAINLQRDDVVQLASLPFVEAIMKKVKEIDENFYFGGVYLFEGMYYGGRPPMLGGNMDYSEKAFNKSSDITKGKLLLVPLFKAKTFCIQTQNFNCFKENIDYVLNSPENIFPEQNLANSLARKKARRLWDHYNEYFLETEN